MTASARVIADSISGDWFRVVTMEVVIHRFVLAEFNTHRAFSRNSASSRAIPVSKQIARVGADPAMPLSWPQERPGMQGGGDLHGVQLTWAQDAWRRSINDTRDAVNRLTNVGLHKSVTNRLLEPFMWHTVVVTATDWFGFFNQRCSPLAQPEIRAAAEAMRDAFTESQPRELVQGDWHLPYLHEDERDAMEPEMAIKVSAARCARVSYLTQNGVRDHEEDVRLYDKLVGASPMHASPLEHVCTPNPRNVVLVNTDTWERARVVWESGPPQPCLVRPLYGNLRGWHQHRFDVENANG